MNCRRLASLLILLAALTLVSEGVVHEAHMHGTLNPTCVCHNLILGADIVVAGATGALLPPTGTVQAPAPEFFSPSVRSTIDGTRAPPALA